MRSRTFVAWSGAVLVLAACGPHNSSVREDASPPTYEVTGHVIANDDHGPELCFGYEESDPPDCDGRPIVGFDWNDVDDEDLASGGTRSGTYRLVGHWVDGTLSLTEPPGAKGDWRAEPEYTPPPPAPCTPPATGWPQRSVSPEGTGALADHPGYAGGWIHNDTGVVTVQFAGAADLDALLAEARDVVGEPVCVHAVRYPLQQLDAAMEAMVADPGELDIVGGEVQVSQNRVLFTAMLVTDEQRRAVDERFGPGLVQFEQILVPVAP